MSHFGAEISGFAPEVGGFAAESMRFSGRNQTQRGPEIRRKIQNRRN
jgi:hypothetical protein